MQLWDDLGTDEHLGLSQEGFEESTLKLIHSPFPDNADDTNSDYDYDSDSDLDDLDQETDFKECHTSSVDSIVTGETTNQVESEAPAVSSSRSSIEKGALPENMHMGRVMLIKNTAFST